MKNMLGRFPIAGKTIAITGGGSGIGLALSKAALASKANVIIADLRLSPEAEKLVEQNKAARFIPCDVRKWKDLEALIPFSEKSFGDVPDVYAANAGVCSPEWSNFWDDKETERYAELDINLSHPIKMTRIAIRALTAKKKKGVVLLTSSIAGLHGHYSTALYVASKHGIIGFIKSLGLAEREIGVKVVGICPGLVRTPLIANLQDKLNGSQVDPQMLEPEEIAGRMIELIEEEKYPGGTALRVAKPGDATIVAFEPSLLESVAPSDLGHVRQVLSSEQGTKAA